MNTTASIFPQNKTINVDLCGFEGDRHTVLGNKLIRELGCNLVYSLKDADIYAFGEDLKVLKRELNFILNNKNILIYRGVWQRGLELRIRNALEAIEVAEKHDDVGVWLG